MLDLKRMLLGAGYPEELIWAPSYLGQGVPDRDFPHTNNINELREFVDAVCEYVAANVVDVIAHSLGCSLAYSVCRGLEKQTRPVNWSEPKKWHRVGTFVALAGAFHGLGETGPGEWATNGEFMSELLAETLGGGGETPYADGDDQTPEPHPHTITYFCGVAKGDFIDIQRPGTGKLAGATNLDYELGPDLFKAHEEIKESRKVFADFLPHLNSVPPTPSVTMAVDKDAGSYATPLTISVTVDPPQTHVDFVANRLRREFLGGYIVDKALETQRGSLTNGETLVLGTDGMWEATFQAEGTVDDIKRTYWLGVKAIGVTILTDSTTPFVSSQVVEATTTDPRATLYHSLDGELWAEGASVPISSTSLVSFVAIGPDGIASEVVSKAFTKLVREHATANVNQHFLAGRLDAVAYQTYLSRFGLAAFTLYLVGGRWVLDPDEGREGRGTPTLTASHESERYTEPVTVTLSARDEVDPSPRIYFTTDGSEPTTTSPSFRGSGELTFERSGTKTLKYFAESSSGTATGVETRTYELDLPEIRPVIKVRDGDPQPGAHRTPVTITIDATDDKDDHVTVRYTTEGSIPSELSPAFEDSKRFEIEEPGNHALVCYAKDSDGNETYEAFLYAIEPR
jgi:hypothetical protein